MSRRLASIASAASLFGTLAFAQPPVRVSIASDGTQADGASSAPAIGETGRFVAFTSDASNLVERDTNGVSDVFVHDRDADEDGVFDEPGAVRTERVSVSTDGTEGNAASHSANLSADGRYVVFVSSSRNLVAGLAPLPGEVYRHDRLRHETILVSVAPNDALAHGHCWFPSISRDGRFVAFASMPGIPDPGNPFPPSDAVAYLRDIERGALAIVSPPLPPPYTTSGPHVRYETSFTLGGPYLTADGSIVASSVNSHTLARFFPFGTATFRSGSVSVYDTHSGTLSTAISPGTIGGASDDGGVLALISSGALDPPDLVPVRIPPDPAFLDVRANRLDIIDLGRGSPSWVSTNVSLRTASGDGRYSLVSVNDVPPDDPAIGTHLVDRATLTATRLAALGTSGSESADLDREGRFLAFDHSTALIPSDTNGTRDVFVLDLDTAFDADGDGLDDRWENAAGLSIGSALGNDGPAGDPDGDGRTNFEEHRGGGHPRAKATEYVAEGAQSAFFTTSFAIVNPGEAAVLVDLRHVFATSSVPGQTLRLPGRSRRTVNVHQEPGVAGAFGTVVESDGPIVIERRTRWDESGYGGHSGTAAAALSTTWYFAEGSTSGPFDLFYLLLNPATTPVSAYVVYLRPNGRPPIVKHYRLPAESRTTIQVGADDPALADTDAGAAILATGPIAVERAMYLNAPGEPPWRGGTAGTGATAPALTWYLPEGATGPFFELFLLLANPTSDTAQVEATFLTATGDALTGRYTLAPWSRTTIWVDREVFAGAGMALAFADVSTIVTSTNDVPFVAERTMWWPGDGRPWNEGHSSSGSTGTGARWAMADGEEGGAAEARTYVLVTNVAAAAVDVAITLLHESGRRSMRTLTVGPRRRVTIPVRDAFTLSASAGRFGVLVESADAGAQLVVERATYWDASGVTWAGGTSAMGRKLP